MKKEKIFNNLKFVFEYQLVGSNIINGFVYDKIGNSCFINISYSESLETDLSVNVKNKIKTKDHRNADNRSIILGRFIDRCLRTIIKNKNLQINIFDDTQNRSFVFKAVMFGLEEFGIGINLEHICDDNIDLSLGTYKGCIIGFEMSCKNLSIKNILDYIKPIIVKTKFKTDLSCIKTADTRTDGRKFDQIREIQITSNRQGNEILFTRGNTSVLSSIDHYELTDFSPNLNCFYEFRKGSRRDVGHGNIIYNALYKHLNVPLNIETCSRVCNADGSTALTSVCGVSIASYNLGINDNLIAGVTVGCIISSKEKTQYCVDLCATEDMEISIMDAKITSSLKGITAAQIDFKIPFAHDLKKILTMAFTANKKIIKTMKANCFKHKQFFSFYTIPSDRIGMIIGSNGKNIKNISELVHGMIRVSQKGICMVKAGDIKLFNKFMNFYLKTLENNMEIGFFLKEDYKMSSESIVSVHGQLRLFKTIKTNLPKGTCIIGIIQEDLSLLVKKIIQMTNKDQK